MNIYIGNLAYQITEDSLKELFEEFGAVESAKVIKDRFSGRSKGFGFVEMPNNSEADKAIKALNGKQYENKTIKVNQANPEGKNRRSHFKKRRY